MGKQIEIAGYPVDKTQGKMFWHSSRIARTGHSVINYRADTYGGQSGAPAFARIPRDGKTAYIAVGIHKGSSGAFNRATRINSAVNEKLKAWKTLS